MPSLLSAASWTLDNGVVSRTVTFDQNGLHTDSLRLKATGVEYVRGRADEFSVNVNRRTLNGRSAWQLMNTVSVPAGLTVVLHSAEAGVDISVHYAAYNDEPATRKWLTITNTSKTPETLTHVAFEQLQARPGDPADCALSAGYGTIPRELFYTGRVSDGAMFLRNVRTHDGLAVINEAPGYLKRTDMGQSWGTWFSVGYDTDLFPFERSLAPGESFTSAASSIVLFRDGYGMLDSHWAVPGYMSRFVMRRGRGYQPAWIYNTWEPFERRINQQTVADLVPATARMRFDIFTIDDGWQLRYGDNADNKEAFPDGVPGVSKMLTDQNMKLGLWVPLAAIGTDTEDYKNHPELRCEDENHKPKITGTASGAQGLMCLGSGYRDLALHRLSDLVDKYHPAYLKVDLTTVFNAYGEAPGCHATGHFHKTWAESLDRIYESLEYIGRKFHEQHPDVLVDYTFELWGEKHLIDAALLGVADLDWLSNVHDGDANAAGPRQARMLLYQRAASIPVETMLIGNLHAGVTPIEERFGVAIGSGPVMLGDLRNMSEADEEWWGKHVAWYRELRANSTLNDSFFPLGDWNQPGLGAWDGFARLSRDRDGIVALFRGTADSAHLSFIAPPGANYRVRSVLDGRDLGTVSAEQFAHGFDVGLDRNHAVTILELKR